MPTRLRSSCAMQANKTGDQQSYDQDKATHGNHSFMQSTIYTEVNLPGRRLQPTYIIHL